MLPMCASLFFMGLIFCAFGLPFPHMIGGIILFVVCFSIIFLTFYFFEVLYDFLEKRK